MTNFAKIMTEDNQEACQSANELKYAKKRLQKFMRAKHGRVQEFFNRYYTGDAVSYRTVHRVLFEDGEDYHGVWELTVEFFEVEKAKEDALNEKIIKSAKA